MKMSKRLMLPMVAIAFVGASAIGVTAVSAATNSQSGSLAAKLASAFNLDQSKVQAVLDADHNEHQAAREIRYQERLAQAVKDGQLTETQKTAILTKHNELKTKLEATKDKTAAERRSLMNQIRSDTEAWAKTHSIDAKWLMPDGGRGHNHGGPHGEGPMPDEAPAS